VVFHETDAKGWLQIVKQGYQWRAADRFARHLALIAGFLEALAAVDANR